MTINTPKQYRYEKLNKTCLASLAQKQHVMIENMLIIITQLYDELGVEPRKNIYIDTAKAMVYDPMSTQNI